MKNQLIITSILFAWGTVFYSCNKYENVTESKLSGKLQIRDTLSLPIATTMSKVNIFFNVGSDTTSYVSKSITDSMGNFALPIFNKNGGLIYANFLKDNIIYQGSVQVSASSAPQTDLILIVRPVFKNGFSISFGPSPAQLPNYPFRIYVNRSAASVDSVKFSIINDKTNAIGTYRKYNLLPRRYYISAKDSVTGSKAKLLDSIDIPESGTISKNITVH